MLHFTEDNQQAAGLEGDLQTNSICPTHRETACEVLPNLGCQRKAASVSCGQSPGVQAIQGLILTAGKMDSGHLWTVQGNFRHTSNIGYGMETHWKGEDIKQYKSTGNSP